MCESFQAFCRVSAFSKKKSGLLRSGEVGLGTRFSLFRPFSFFYQYQTANGTNEMAESNEMKAKHDPLLPSNYFASTLQNADGTVNMRSLTHFTHEKAGMANVDKAHINKVVYEMSKNSAYFKNEQRKSDQLTKRIEELKAKIASINRQAELPSYALFEAEAARVVNARLSALVADRDLSRVFIHVDLDMFYAVITLISLISQIT